MAKINYSKFVYVLTAQQVKKEVLQAAESSPKLRKEISRVFHQANRRIQNIEKSGLYSPAVAALNKGNISGFTKFSMKQDWETLKIEYGKAVAFLRQPTSTASGVRQYNEHIRKEYDLTKDEFDLMSKSLNNKLTSISDTEYVERYLMYYKDFTGELENAAAEDVSIQIESEAEQIQRALDANIERAANQAVKDHEKMVDEIERILDSFNKFGL